MSNFKGDWATSTHYHLGDEVEYEGHKYKAIQPHLSRDDWTPIVTPKFWERVSDVCRPVGEYSVSKPEQKDPPTYQGYESQNPPPEQQKPQTAQPYTAPSGVQVEHHETGKKWFELDKTKKDLLVGGGLALGLGMLGAGAYFVHEKHKKNDEEEQRAQAWELQNWMVAARQRSEEFYKSGPKGPTTWVINTLLDEHKDLERDLIPGGEEKGTKLFIARAPYHGTLQVGKWKPDDKYAIIGFGHKEIQVAQFEVLIGAPQYLKWVSAKGELVLSELKDARPVEGGHEEDGTPLYIAHGNYKGNVIPGKASSKLDGVFVPYDDDEKEVKEYEVLCYA